MTSPTHNQSLLASLDWGTLWRAMVTTGTFVLPIAILQVWLRESDRIGADDPLNLALFGLIFVGGMLGGFAAAKLAPRLPLQHAAFAAGGTVLVIHVVNALRHMFAGDDISNPLGWILQALSMAVMGMFGAWVNEKVSPPRHEG